MPQTRPLTFEDTATEIKRLFGTQTAADMGHGYGFGPTHVYKEWTLADLTALQHLNPRINIPGVQDNVSLFGQLLQMARYARITPETVDYTISHQAVTKQLLDNAQTDDEKKAIYQKYEKIILDKAKQAQAALSELAPSVYHSSPKQNHQAWEDYANLIIYVDDTANGRPTQPLSVNVTADKSGAIDPRKLPELDLKEMKPLTPVSHDVKEIDEKKARDTFSANVKLTPDQTMASPMFQKALEMVKMKSRSAA